MHTSGDDRELRRKRAQTLHELEMMFRAEGCGDFVYDEEHDLFCFPEDGRFAFSKEWADIELSRNVATMGEITSSIGRKELRPVNPDTTSEL